jgi:hypothetical protein
MLCPMTKFIFKFLVAGTVHLLEIHPANLRPEVVNLGFDHEECQKRELGSCHKSVTINMENDHRTFRCGDVIEVE